MNASENQFTGTWLDTGSQRGQQFTHDQDQYDHADEGGAKPMRHAMIEQDGQQVGVWVPADWSDEQAREALEQNW